MQAAPNIAQKKQKKIEDTLVFSGPGGCGAVALLLFHLFHNSSSNIEVYYH